ncbi:glycosyltransferase family 4 protein [Hymenobacter coccineus]|uniref:Glycosyltransferase subfamily 4-like N-terminal domain-containing protein n=1 Tax=Hymenobacter coccineus TaxID=1908235 RepID=A0A1G1TM30_9BACT|nr:glycosyltransferase family 4 protein [Hymenobacter coccineus]OGX91927.1 hypothetical protein BEN49_03815 [Hymenobacter coccineus]
MKVLYVCSEFYAGMLPFATSIVNAMPAATTYGVFVCTPQCDYRQTIQLPPSHCVFIDFPANKLTGLLAKLYPAQLLRAIEHTCRTQGIDLIHLLTEDTSLAYYLGRLEKLAPVLYTVHDLFPHPAQHRHALAWAMRHFLVKKRVDYLLAHATNLITCSKTQYEWMVKHFPEKRIFSHAFPTLVTNSITEGTAVVPELVDVPNYTLFFGRIEKYKGLEVLYDAYLKTNSLQQQPLVIAGSGHIYFDRQLEQEQNIIFINRYINDNEIKQLFSKAHCIVFPYTSATQSGVLSLAFYFQVPAVVSNIPFLQELVEEGVTGFLFDSTDSDALGQKLVHIQTEDLSKVMSRGYENYTEFYGVSALKNQLQQAYDMLSFSPIQKQETKPA